MVLKPLLGEIMTDMGFITKRQLEKALIRQKEIFKQRTLTKKAQASGPIYESRIARYHEKTPLLGIILNYMGLATLEEIEKALEKQRETTDIYRSMDSEKLGRVLEIGAVINSTIHLDEVIILIMKFVNRVVDSASSTLMFRDDKTGDLIFTIPMGIKKDEFNEVRVPFGKGIAGWVAEREKPLLIQNAEEDPRYNPEFDRTNGSKIKTILCLPLKAKSGLIGVLEIINKLDGTPFTEEDTLLLRIFAYQTTVAIENARLYSQLKENLEEEVQIQKEMAKYEKVEALGQMASSVAHEFNNLLMHIQGQTSLMLLDMDKSHPYYERLKSIEQAVTRGSEVSKQLLGYARDEKRDVKKIDINEIVERSSEVFGRTKKEVKIYRKYQTDVRAVEADQGQIEHILLNLYKNAWKAMPGGGELFLEVENARLDNDFVKPYDLEPGDYVKISIKDTGIGMDKASQEKIFDPFFTTKETVRGTGLGLASAYGIIKNHRGIIEVQSVKGVGTTFSIYLPAMDRAIKQETEVLSGHTPDQSTVLLVDDEEMIIEVGKEMLEKMNYKVFTTQNGTEAVEIFNENKDNIDLIILDLVMPDMGGGELYDRMREINPDVKVILSSGYSMNGEASAILARGCDGFIQKPFTMNDLSSKIRVILD
jgi:signal transduction histidine kinase